MLCSNACSATHSSISAGHTNPANGLVADTTRAGAPSSIAVVGFALSAYPVGGRARLDDARRRGRAASPLCASSGPATRAAAGCATGYKGFYYHFLDMHSGARVWRPELSLIDTALLIAGMLTAASISPDDSPDEREIRELADALYRRVDWRWAQRDGSAVMHGWKPECGFLHYGWEGYSEAILLYVLGLGSPTHPLDRGELPRLDRDLPMGEPVRLRFSLRGPALHPPVLARLDRFSRHPGPLHAREGGCDYFENSRRATYVQREYATRNPRSFAGYDADCWGLSAGDGPSVEPRLVAGRRQAFFGYAARGVPYGPDDGTIAGASTLSSLPFAPEIVAAGGAQLCTATRERTATNGSAAASTRP